MTPTAIAQSDAAALLAARLGHLAVRLDAAAAELAAADPGSWRGPARAAFTVARSAAHERLVAAAVATDAAAALARRAAQLAEEAVV